MREFNISSLLAGIVFIVLGVLFLLDRLGVLALSGHYVWPIVLVAIGVAVITGGGRRSYRSPYRHWHRDDDRPSSPPPPPPPPPPPAAPSE